MTQKKTLSIIILIFTLVLGGLFFAYQFFIADSGPNGLGGETIDGGGRGTLFPSSGLLGEDKKEDTEQNGFIPTLRQISSSPTSGGIVFNSETDTVIRYVERATGHIFETTGKSLEQNRISNTTIPRIQESIWSPNGDMVILRYLDENEVLKSFYGKVSGDVGTLEGWFLSNNITDMDVHEDGDIFYIQKVGGGTKGLVSNFDGTNSKTVFSSTVGDWTPQWMKDSTTVTTKASSGVDGFLYRTESGVRTKILSTEGLIVKISPNGNYILVSLTDDAGEIDLFIANRNTEKALGLSFITLADKCVWGSNIMLFCASPHSYTQEGVLPDDWYKGKMSFSDNVWSYNTETETARLVYDAEAEGVVFDAINLAVDSEGDTLLFTNKNDLTLWALSLKQ